MRMLGKKREKREREKEKASERADKVKLKKVTVCKGREITEGKEANGLLKSALVEAVETS